jgi:hypothetical protein
MNRLMTNVLASLLLVGAVARVTPAAAQRPDLSGRWIYNASQSDNPLDRIQGADTTGDPGRAGGRRGGGLPGMDGRGGFGGGRGRFRGSSGGFPGGSGMTDEQRQRNRQAVQLAFRAPRRLTIAQTDSTVTFTADDTPALALSVDGRRVRQKADSGEVEVRARWQGSAFVVERSVSGGGKVSEDYGRSQDGKQLFVIVGLDLGRRAVVFRRVYDAAGSM